MSIIFDNSDERLLCLYFLLHTMLHAAGGVFKLEMFLPEDYPMEAPRVCTACATTKLRWLRA